MVPMPNSLRVLILEDRSADAELMLQELRQAGFDPHWRRVDTEPDYIAHLDLRLDVILADYSLPQFDARRALHLLQKHGLDIPFIIVSATVGEELAVECMKEGAADYLLKDRLARLGQAVTHALDQKRLREEKRQAELALRESKERYELASLGANDGLWDWNLITKETYFSSRWKSMLGCDEHEVANTPDEWFNRIHPDDLEQVKSELTAHLEGRTPHFEHDYRMRHNDGTYRWMLTRGLLVQDASGKGKRIAGSLTDITKRKLAEERLLHDAFHDALTNLPNRALFMDRLGRSILHGRRRPAYLFAVLFMDLDRFKIVNDSLGHAAGDQLLIQVSKRVERCLRPGDTVARLGGDEFAILLDDIKGFSDATRVADRIRLELAVSFYVDGREVFTSASIGIAFSTTGYNRPEEVLRDADTAMYRAKGLGKGRFEVFDTTMHVQAMSRLKLETDLRRALEHQEFLVYHQAIVSLETGRISGFEALLRWQHPQGGLMCPAEYLSVAEETGLLIPIGRWMLREACLQLRTWQAQFIATPPLSMSVNLSCKQFLQSDLVKQIEQTLLETGLEPGSLRLEITETVVMENALSAIDKLSQLRALYVQTSMDDFGTGYSSLSYLQRFPFDTLKIDQSFINSMGLNRENLEIVRTIVTLAHNLGRKVIAEGVETAEQLSLLRSLKCEYGQGYFFSQPLDCEAAEALLAAGRQW